MMVARSRGCADAAGLSSSSSLTAAPAVAQGVQAVAFELPDVGEPSALRWWRPAG